MTDWPLTMREWEVLSLSSEGMRNEDIAKHLFVEIATVKFHKSNAFKKLRAKNTTHAVAIAVRTGLIR